jgi:hypothetical protein
MLRVTGLNQKTGRLSKHVASVQVSKRLELHLHCTLKMVLDLTVGYQCRFRNWLLLLLLTQEKSRYTSFTGSSLLFFSASQKLLFLELDEVALVLSYAASFMSVLSFCSATSKAAQNLYWTLQPLYSNLRELAFSPVCKAMRRANLVISEATLESDSSFDSIPGAKEICHEILDAARCVMDVLRKGIHA